jgi:hypothetical protein
MGYHQRSRWSDWEEVEGCFPAKHQGFKGKARDNGPGFPIYEAGGGGLMLTLWLKIVTVMITVRIKLTIRKRR